MNNIQDNTCLSRKSTPLSIMDYVDHQREKAYKWAKDEQKRMGCMAEPIKIGCNGKDQPEIVESYFTNTQCVASIFVSSDRNATPILRRDWLDDGGIKYNLLHNYNELKTI